MFEVLNALEGIQILIGLNLSAKQIAHLNLPKKFPDKIFLFLDENVQK